MKSISTEEFDRRFDEGEELDEFLDSEHPVVHKAKPRVVLNPPEWLLAFYDAEAERRGIARKAVMNTALVEWADEQRERAKRIASQDEHWPA